MQHPIFPIDVQNPVRYIQISHQHDGLVVYPSLFLHFSPQGFQKMHLFCDGMSSRCWHVNIEYHKGPVVRHDASSLIIQRGIVENKGIGLDDSAFSGIRNDSVHSLAALLLLILFSYLEENSGVMFCKSTIK